MGRACSIHGKNENWIQHFGGKKKGRDHLGDLDVGEKYY
jgi:hypothetical protein